MKILKIWGGFLVVLGLCALLLLGSFPITASLPTLTFIITSGLCLVAMGVGIGIIAIIERGESEIESARFTRKSEPSSVHIREIQSARSASGGSDQNRQSKDMAVQK